MLEQCETRLFSSIQQIFKQHETRFLLSLSSNEWNVGDDVIIIAVVLFFRVHRLDIMYNMIQPFLLNMDLNTNQQRKKLNKLSWH